MHDELIAKLRSYSPNSGYSRQMREAANALEKLVDAIGQARAVDMGDVYQVFGPDWEAIEKAAGFE